MKFKRIQIPFYFGLSILVIASLFGVMHWPGGSSLLLPGIALYGLFLILVIVEIVSSPKASGYQKAIWASVYLIAPILALSFLPVLVVFVPLLILGSLYLSTIRKQFLFTKTIGEKIPFDILKENTKG